MIASFRLPVLVTLICMSMGASAVVAEDDVPRYEMRGNLIIDTRTGLTYDKRDAEQEREAYRRLLESRGQRVPAVPLILSEEQRAELAQAEIDRELDQYRDMQRQLGLGGPDDLKALSPDQREDLQAWRRISVEAERFCRSGQNRDEDPYCLASERTRLWYEWEATKASRMPGR